MGPRYLDKSRHIELKKLEGLRSTPRNILPDSWQGRSHDLHKPSPQPENQGGRLPGENPQVSGDGSSGADHKSRRNTSGILNGY
jgi:hypothetical protein